MDMIKKQQKTCNDFAREYLDPRIRVEWNRIKLSGTSKEHQDMVYEVCWWLYQNNIPFATEVTFKSGYNPDIICPSHIKPIIEIRWSETEKKTLEKFSRIPEELHKQIIYVEAGQEFNELMIL